MTDLPLVADDFPAALTEAVRLTDTVLDKLLVRPEGPEARVVEAMRYSALAPGKRLRPFLVLASAQLFSVARRSALQAAGVNPASVKEVNVGFNLVPAMLSGRVAATLGGFWNYEAIQLTQMHRHPVTIPVDRAGVPPYDELVLVVRAQDARKRGQRSTSASHCTPVRSCLARSASPSVRTSPQSATR